MIISYYIILTIVWWYVFPILLYNMLVRVTLGRNTSDIIVTVFVWRITCCQLLQIILLYCMQCVYAVKVEISMNVCKHGRQLLFD